MACAVLLSVARAAGAQPATRRCRPGRAGRGGSSIVSRSAAGQRHGAGGAGRRAAQHRRASRRSRLLHGPADLRLHPAGAAGGPARHREDRGVDPVRRHEHLHLGADVGQPSRARDRQRAAPRQRQHPRQRELHVRDRHVPRQAERLHVPDQPARGAARHDDHRRPAELGLERHLVRQDRPLRAGLDDGGGDPVQVAALSRQRRADLGHQPAAAGEVEERVLVPVAGAGGARHHRRQPDGVGGDGDRHRDAVGVEEPGAEALRGVVRHDQPDRLAAVRQRLRCQRRARLQVRADAQPDPRRDLPHRLRAGRRGSPAGQPHALQPVLPGEARLLHRRPGHLRLRRRAGRQQSGRRADSLLQPADRPQFGTGGAGRRRRAADGTHRPLQRRRCSTSRPTTIRRRGRCRPTSPRCASSGISSAAATSA